MTFLTISSNVRSAHKLIQLYHLLTRASNYKRDLRKQTLNKLVLLSLIWSLTGAKEAGYTKPTAKAKLAQTSL